MALSNVRMEEEAPAEEEKKDSVLPGAPPCRKLRLGLRLRLRLGLGLRLRLGLWLRLGLRLRLRA